VATLYRKSHTIVHRRCTACTGDPAPVQRCKLHRFCTSVTPQVRFIAPSVHLVIMSHTADIDYLAEISTRQTPALTPTILGILRPAQSIQDFTGMSDLICQISASWGSNNKLCPGVWPSAPQRGSLTLLWFWKILINWYALCDTVATSRNWSS
jgi:hypothetical protein